MGFQKTGKATQVGEAMTFEQTQKAKPEVKVAADKSKPTPPKVEKTGPDFRK